MEDSSVARSNLLEVPVSTRTGFPVASVSSNGISLSIPRVPVTTSAVSFWSSIGGIASKVEPKERGLSRRG